MNTDSAGVKARAHLKISGRVQGVSYRYSMVREAQNLGLTGWVRNCDDGSVEAVAEGPRANIESLIGWSRQGPAGARVDKVAVQWESPDNTFSGFVVRR
jgi:acylphosphatase